MKCVIIGGVAGGATAAARIRRITEKADILLLEKGEYISYANCGLPYYIGGVIKEREKLFVQTPNSFGRRFNVDVRVNSEVVKIDRERNEVIIKTTKISKNPDSTTTTTYKEYSESYDKLLLSPGASPVVPPLQGINSKGIFTLRNVTDTDKIKQYIEENNIENAVIVGGGFIGLEMAENLHAVGAKVSIVEMGDQVMSPIDFSMAQIVHAHLIEKGVKLYLSDAVTSFEENTKVKECVNVDKTGEKCGANGDLSGNKIIVNLKSGEKIGADIVILSIGVRPNVNLAKEAGIEIGVAGGIKVNEYLQTNDSNIYAVGDAIEYPHPVSGASWLNYLAVPANRQGRIVADNIVKGNVTKYEGAIGTAIAKVFDLTVATTGLPAKKLATLNIPYTSSTTHGASNAGYYPGAMPLTIKVTFGKEDGKLLGGQIVGYQGVDKRVDEIALVIKQGGSIYDLIELEQAYAPPFSSAKDPVAIAGYVAANILEGAVNPIYWREVRDKVAAACATNGKSNGEAPFTILDVRTPQEFNTGHIEGAINIPLDEIRNIVEDCDINGGEDLPAKYAEVLHPSREIIVNCAIGLRGYLAYRILVQSGYKNVKNLVGGYKTYSMATAKLNCKMSCC